MSLKVITHNSGSIKGIILETVKVTNFSLNFQRKFQLVQHHRLIYGTYGTLRTWCKQEWSLSLKHCIYRYVEGEFYQPARKETNMSYTSHSNVYKITEGCFVHGIGKCRGLPETYEFPTLCLVFLRPSTERKSLVVSS